MPHLPRALALRWIVPCKVLLDVNTAKAVYVLKKKKKPKHPKTYQFKTFYNSLGTKEVLLETVNLFESPEYHLEQYASLTFMDGASKTWKTPPTL